MFWDYLFTGEGNRTDNGGRQEIKVWEAGGSDLSVSPIIQNTVCALSLTLTTFGPSLSLTPEDEAVPSSSNDE